MAIRREGYRNFIRKVEGNDNVLETEGSGGWKYTRYEQLAELGTCRIDWNTFYMWVCSLSSEERQAINVERNRLGVPIFFNDTMGCDQPMRIAYSPTGEPEPRHQASEQQSSESDAPESDGTLTRYNLEQVQLFIEGLSS